MEAPLLHPQIPTRVRSSFGVLSEELVERGELIFQFNCAELVANRGHKLAVAAGSTAIVEGKDRESSPG